MKKIYAIIFILCLLPILSACGRTKPTAADSVQAIYDLYIMRKTTGAAKLGMTEEDIANALTAYDNALSQTIRSNFSDSGLEISDETMDEICQARRDALARMQAKCTLTSVEDQTALVTLSTTYFDEDSLDKDAAYNAREEADAAGFTNYDEYLNFIMDTYTKNLIEGYKSVVPSEDTKDISVTCIIVNNTWLPEDMTSFGSQLGAAVSGQE